MTKIQAVVLAGRTVFVEIEPASMGNLQRPDGSGPEGSEETGFADRLHDAAGIIRDTIEGLAEIVLQARKTIAPNECEIEIGFAFRGENQPIPILVKVGGEASIKVKAKWTMPPE
jgi:hypothetical protein